MMNSFSSEVKQGKRFRFGRNWRRFLATISPDRIRIAEESITEMLGEVSLAGKAVVDVGSGSGLFSLAARNLGSARVVSFDYDPDSVKCTEELRSKFYGNDPDWTIERGSILDSDYICSLGSFDIVYSWGVLHHTGDMWSALNNVSRLVKPGGYLFVALYNDQGWISSFWKKVKEAYCSGLPGRTLVSVVFIPYFFLGTLVAGILRGENAFAEYKRKRGMSACHDWIDWLGGLPFEVAKVEDCLRFFKKRGFSLEAIKTTNNKGNNEFVFVRNSCDPLSKIND